MTPQEAIRILMLSPLYFELKLRERLCLIKEFCEIHTAPA